MTQHKIRIPSHVYLLSVMAVIVIVSCRANATSENPLVDRSFLTEQPCTPPCWYGLELDKSTREDVYATLKKLPFIDSNRIEESGTNWFGDENAQQIVFSCLAPPKIRCGEAILSKGKLKSLRLPVGYELTFEMAIQRLGEPEYVDFRLWHPEGGGSDIILQWPKKLISVEYLDTHSQNALEAIADDKGVPHNLKVTAIYYSTFTGPGGANRVPWPGFQR